MKCLTRDESDSWLRQSFGGDDTSLHRIGPYRIPHDAGKKMALAKNLLEYWLEWDGDGLLLVKEYGVWSSCEHLPLFDGYRRAFGENRSLDEAPGHLLTAQNLENTISLFALALYFMWDTLLVSSTNRLLIETTHHEEMMVAGSDPDPLATFQKRLHAFLA